MNTIIEFCVFEVVMAKTQLIFDMSVAKAFLFLVSIYDADPMEYLISPEKSFSFSVIPPKM